MRIIAGSARGTRIQVPKDGARPTADRVRESLFSILTALVAEAKVLDLYAGSGALGIEALSRGAAAAQFIDSSREACDIIQRNLQHTKVEGSTRVICGDVLSTLGQRHGTTGAPFDLIFADPPYARSADGGELALLLGSDLLPDLLSADGILIAERSIDFPNDAHQFPRLDQIDTRKYGATALDFYRPAEAEAEA